MASTCEFTHTLIVPKVDTFHEVLAAFLQTSDQGGWSVDPEQESNQFKCNFIRGNWGTSFFGLGAKRVPQEPTLRDDKVIVRTQPMRLEIVIRPYQSSLRVRIMYSVFSTEGDEVLRISDTGDKRTKSWDQWIADWHRVVTNEVNDFRNYLQECFGLSEPPKLETD